MKYSIGIDLGGTNIRIAIVDETGKIVDVIKERTNKGTLDDIASQIVSLYNKIDKKDYEIIGLGIGLPGPVNKDGSVPVLPNLNIFETFNLKELLKDRINLPIYLGNDANVAGLGEAKVGNGKGYEVVQYITLSTGIGGGLCINGKIVVGKTGSANEVGAMVLSKSNRPCNAKPNGCIEAEASGTALVNKAKEVGLDVIHAGQIFELASTNEKANKIAEEFKNNLATLIGTIYSYMEPDIFILGGGLMKSSDYFLDDVKKLVNNYIAKPSYGMVNIKKAKFDQDAGIIGAAMLAF